MELRFASAVDVVEIGDHDLVDLHRTAHARARVERRATGVVRFSKKLVFRGQLTVCIFQKDLGIFCRDYCFLGSL